MKKEIFRFRRILLIVFPILAGASVIIGNIMLSHQFDTSMVYYMYSYIAQYFLLYFSVAYWGVEFQKKTINLLIISGQSHMDLYVAKFLTYILHILIFFLCSYFEVAFYCLLTKQNIALMETFLSMLGAYIMYGSFSYTCSTIIVMMTKKFVISLVASWMLMSIVPAVTMILQGTIIENCLKYIPFSFIVEVFSFSKYTAEQFVITMIWVILANFIGYFMLVKRGRV